MKKMFTKLTLLLAAFVLLSFVINNNESIKSGMNINDVHEFIKKDPDFKYEYCDKEMNAKFGVYGWEFPSMYIGVQSINDTIIAVYDFTDSLEYTDFITKK